MARDPSREVGPVYRMVKEQRGDYLAALEELEASHARLMAAASVVRKAFYEAGTAKVMRPAMAALVVAHDEAKALVVIE